MFAEIKGKITPVQTMGEEKQTKDLHSRVKSDWDAMQYI
jgi:hypothetical protein